MTIFIYYEIWFKSVHKCGLNAGLTHRKQVLTPGITLASPLRTLLGWCDYKNGKPPQWYSKAVSQIWCKSVHKYGLYTGFDPSGVNTKLTPINPPQYYFEGLCQVWFESVHTCTWGSAGGRARVHILSKLKWNSLCSTTHWISYFSRLFPEK
jgi:hypothetical protein